jgi:hypothetical protein
LSSVDGPPEGYEEIQLQMSNFDHTIDAGFAEALQGGRVFGRHSAWDFNGLVWWDGKRFVEQVSVHRSPIKTFSASTLRDLMEMANDEFGGR